MWDLAPRLGVEPEAPALGRQSLSHWTPRDVLLLSFIQSLILLKLYLLLFSSHWIHSCSIEIFRVNFTGAQ